MRANTDGWTINWRYHHIGSWLRTIVNFGGNKRAFILWLLLSNKTMNYTNKLNYKQNSANICLCGNISVELHFSIDEELQTTNLHKLTIIVFSVFTSPKLIVKIEEPSFAFLFAGVLINTFKITSNPKVKFPFYFSERLQLALTDFTISCFSYSFIIFEYYIEVSIASQNEQQRAFWTSIIALFSSAFDTSAILHLKDFAWNRPKEIP